MPPTNKANSKKGLTLPGYNYLGPFNSLFAGAPVNKADAAARKHDFGYSDLLKEGKNPYLYFNTHDQNLIDELKDDTSFGGKLARGVFQIKKALAPALPGTSKGGDRALKRKLYFARSNKGAKKANREPAPSTSNQQNMEVSNDIPNDEAGNQPIELATRSVGGSGSVGGGGRGGSGVGYSTGGWTGGTIFSENIVVTKNTRQFICDIKNGHLYKSEVLNTGDTAHRQYAITTPWSYFNFNQYSSHFSPNDWQHLVNDYERFRPKAMIVRVYNLQIKQIMTDGAMGTVYNNDLTAGMHIFCDGDHRYPYVQHPWDDQCMPELPNSIWELPQYAYIPAPISVVDNNTTNTVEEHLLKGVPLYMLENSDHEVLRTGESTEFTFNFGDCEWIENNITFSMPQMMYNPLVRSRRIYSYSGPNSQTSNAFQNAALRTSNWMSGPGIARGTHNATLQTQSAGALVTMVTNGADVSGVGAVRVGYSTDPIYGGQQPDSDLLRLRYSTSAAEGQQNPILENAARHTFTREARTKLITGSNGADGDYKEWWMLPNQMWDSAPISRYNPIWVKVPRVNRKTLLDTQDGSIPMSHPPGTIFIKLARIPVPGNGDSFLNIYVTGQVSCEVVWEVEKRGTKNWRPEYMHSATNMSVDAYTINNAGVYAGAVQNADVMQTRFNHHKVL
nr:capsid protein [Bovine parvovirus 1]